MMALASMTRECTGLAGVEKVEAGAGFCGSTLCASATAAISAMVNNLELILRSQDYQRKHVSASILLEVDLLGGAKVDLRPVQRRPQNLGGDDRQNICASLKARWTRFPIPCQELINHHSQRLIIHHRLNTMQSPGHLHS